MRQSVAIFCTCAGLWVVLAGCATSLSNSNAAPPPLPPGGGAPLLSDEQVTTARDLYIAKCANCHKFHSPSNYSEASWDSWMRKMSRKAKLKPADEETLRNYLSLFRR